MTWPSALVANWALAAVGLVLRAIAAGTRPLNPAEALEAVQAATLTTGLPAQPAAPLFTVLTWLGLLVGSDFEWAPRLVPLVASGWLLIVAHRLGTRLVGERAWVLVALVALNPVLVFVGSSVNPMSVALALGAVPAWWWARGERPAGWATGLVAGGLLALGLPGVAVLVLVFGGWVACPARRDPFEIVAALPTALLAFVLGATALGQRPEWVPGLVAHVVWPAAPDPVWYALILLGVYAPLILVGVALGRSHGDRTLIVPVALATVFVLVVPTKDATSAALWAAAGSPIAAVGVARLLAAWGQERPNWNWLLVAPLAAVVFGIIAVGFLARPEALAMARPTLGEFAGVWLFLAGVSAVMLGPLLMLALVVNGQTRVVTAAAALLVLGGVLEFRAIAPLNLQAGVPEVAVRAIGSADATRAMRAARSVDYQNVRLAPQPGVPLLEWWSARRGLDSFPGNDTRLLELTTEPLPGPGRQLSAGTLVLRWDGRFADAASFAQWWLFRGGLEPERVRFFLSQT